MSALSDHIEQFIKALFEEESGQVEVQRNELAQHFGCAPSQINYVLSTRFTMDRGYLIESRRGGGGYIRIVRLDMDKESYLLSMVRDRIGDRLSEDDARGIVANLFERGFISSREAGLIACVLSDKAIGIPSPIRDTFRARLMKVQFLTLLKEE